MATQASALPNDSKPQWLHALEPQHPRGVLTMAVLSSPIPPPPDYLPPATETPVDDTARASLAADGILGSGVLGPVVTQFRTVRCGCWLLNTVPRAHGVSCMTAHCASSATTRAAPRAAIFTSARCAS